VGHFFQEGLKMENTELHPCPLCGDRSGYTVKLQDDPKYWDVACKACETVVSDIKADNLKYKLPQGRTPKADEAWNKAAQYAKGLLDEIEALRKAQPDTPPHSLIPIAWLYHDAGDVEKLRQPEPLGENEPPWFIVHSTNLTFQRNSKQAGETRLYALAKGATPQEPTAEAVQCPYPAQGGTVCSASECIGRGECGCCHGRPEPDPWQPIATAPKDGAKFIGKYGNLVFTTWWQAFYDKWPNDEGGPTYKHHFAHDRGNTHMYEQPTHWQPLPPAPEGV
jgi:hypothetical protein